jgi:cobalt-zinc-cadmium efflux system outer membrane protein
VEAEAALLDATARFRENPIIEANIGPRSSNSTRSTELDIGVSQLFETGGQRQARIAGAQASIERQRYEVDVTARGVIFDAATAFLDGLAATERLRIAEEADTVSRELLHATDRRYNLGDIAAVDLNLARIDAARTGATLRTARADLNRAVGQLRVLLRLSATEPIDLVGSLDLPVPAPFEQLRSVVDQRPEFISLQAESREAEAQLELGRALRRPDVGLRVGYEREQTDTVVLGGLTVTLPTFQRGQGTSAAGAARAARARLQLDTARQAAITELEAAYAVHEQHRLSSEGLVTDAAPSAADNESLAQRSYEAGELNLMEFLLIRRDALETRTAVVDRRLDTARSRLTVDFVAGVLR